MPGVLTADGILFRASGTGLLMVEPKEKAARENGELSESTKTHLVDVFVSAKYGRNTDIQSRATNKGLMVEEDSITSYSRQSKRFLKKNEIKFSNKYICGTPDLFASEDMSTLHFEEISGVWQYKGLQELEVIDVKSSWDIYTFFRSANSTLNKRYYWQLQSYMALTGAKKATLAYCLINTPDALINDEKRKLMWKMNVISDTNPEYMVAGEELDRLMTYDDIPLSEKVFTINIERNDEDILRLYKKIEKCREYMNKYLFKCQTT